MKIEQKETRAEGLACYIAGPISGVPGYMEEFDKWEGEVKRQLGMEPVSPAKVSSMLPEAVYGNYSSFLRMGEAMLSMCDCAFFMPGWETSKGARLEHALAEAWGLDIYVENGGQIVKEV